MENCLNAAEQVRQAGFQASGNLHNIHERHVPNSAFNAGVIRSMQPATFRSLLLINGLFLPDSADCLAKTVFSTKGPVLN
jgi:hypothetical protein